MFICLQFPLWTVKYYGTHLHLIIWQFNESIVHLSEVWTLLKTVLYDPLYKPLPFPILFSSPITCYFSGMILGEGSANARFGWIVFLQLRQCLFCSSCSRMILQPSLLILWPRQGPTCAVTFLDRNAYNCVFS